LFSCFKNDFEKKDDQIGEDQEGEGIMLGGSRNAWEGSDRDYTYEEVFVHL
jgi:hypothetical protein